MQVPEGQHLTPLHRYGMPQLQRPTGAVQACQLMLQSRMPLLQHSQLLCKRRPAHRPWLRIYLLQVLLDRCRNGAEPLAGDLCMFSAGIIPQSLGLKGWEDSCWVNYIHYSPKCHACCSWNNRQLVNPHCWGSDDCQHEMCEFTPAARQVQPTGAEPFEWSNTARTPRQLRHRAPSHCSSATSNVPSTVRRLHQQVQ